MTHGMRLFKTLFATLATFFIVVSLAWGSTSAPEPQLDPAAGEPTAIAIAAPVVATWQQKTEEGFHQLAAGENAAALASFEEALQMNPRGAAAKTGKGIVLTRQGQLQEAEALFKEALVLNPEPTRTHYELGKIYQQQGDFPRAITEFKLGIEKFQQNHP